MAKKKKETAEKQQSEVTRARIEEDKPTSETAPSEKKEREEEPETETEQEEKEGDREPVVTLENELNEQKDKYLRLMAEFDNYKRRTSREYERLVESANERLILDIIEVRENLERALSMADEKHDFTSFLEGMKLIFNKLDAILGKNGLSVFTEVGDVFDPAIHDAMMKTPHDKIPEDHIIQIYEKGYKLKERVIKHAKVIVSAGASGDTEEGKHDENNKESEVPVSED